MTNPDETTALKSYQSVPVEQLESGDAEDTRNLEVSDASLFASFSLRRRSSLLLVTIGMVVFVACMRLSYTLGVKHVATVDLPITSEAGTLSQEECCEWDKKNPNICAVPAPCE
jgi:hypothetical protein